MFQTTHIAGRTVAVLRREGHRLIVVESGRLNFDGEEVSLVAGDFRRYFADTEIDSLMLVLAGNRIPGCKGFDLFLIDDYTALHTWKVGWGDAEEGAKIVIGFICEWKAN